MSSLPVPERSDPTEPSIGVHLVYIEGMLRRMAAEWYPSLSIPADLAALPVEPNLPHIYGDRTGPWGDGVAWLEHWASLGGSWVNLGLGAGEDGTASIRYETQWRAGDPADGMHPPRVWPAFNFFGPPRSSKRP